MWTQDSSLLVPDKAPEDIRGKHPIKMSSLPRDAFWSLEKYLLLLEHRAPTVEVWPAAAESPESQRLWLETGLEERAPEASRGQRQGPECATSLRPHVSRRRRLKMMLASWH